MTPISAEIDLEGRLLRADEALYRLNQRAGGVKGGVLAVPPLLALVQLALKLRMRLSRAVRVADDSGNLELWAEVDPKPDIVYVSITSWRAMPTPWTQATRSIFGLDAAWSGASLLRFDRSLRLIRATGIVIDGLTASDFGQAAAVFLPRYFQNSPGTTSLLAQMQAYSDFSSTLVVRLSDNKSLLIAGGPVTDTDENIAGYDCMVTYPSDGDAADADSTAALSQEILFGTKLAPALHQPLDRIIANAETIGNEMQGPIRENYAVYARDIVNAARHLSALVEDLGDLEAIERPDFTTAADQIELGDIARRVAGLLTLKAADRDIQIITPSTDDHVPATAEFRRVLQIALNLIGNAIRYTRDGTKIVIHVYKDGDDAVMTVSDEGSGIDPANRKKIFDKFERLGRSGDGGSGLGLYISRKLARVMKGDLTVDETPSGGARFTLRLPAAAQR